MHKNKERRKQHIPHTQHPRPSQGHHHSIPLPTMQGQLLCREDQTLWDHFCWINIYGHFGGNRPSWGQRGERAMTDSQTTQSPKQNSPSNKAWSKQIIFVVRKSVSTYRYNYHLWFCHSGKVAAAALIRVRLSPVSC